ncbi:MAG: lipopolysaccharide heptosyltransferase II, partial [Planctomycetes bacterium]|nr:lipopolysaccharide heptosyltransferase II [Planctomycetota bacterium]
MVSPRKIITILPNWVGDVVMATPALRALRNRFSQSRITLLGRPIAIETVDGLDSFDETLVDGSGGGAFTSPAFLGGLFKLVGRLRAERFDLAILLPNSFRSALTARLAGISRIVGYSRDARGWMLTDSLDPPRDADGGYTPISAVDYYNNLAALLGAECDSRRMELAVGAEAAARGERLLDEAGAEESRPIVMLNPGASFGVSKMWNPQRYAAVADALIESRNAQIIINAAPNERKIAATVAGNMRSRPLLNFAELDNSISLLKALTRRSSLMISNDTGARHIAAGLGTPVVTLFGSTDPRWASFDFGRERIIRVEVPCSPCGQRVCTQPAGPLYHQCMSAITTEMVLAAAEELLAGASAAPAARMPA